MPTFIELLILITVVTAPYSLFRLYDFFVWKRDLEQKGRNFIYLLYSEFLWRKVPTFIWVFQLLWAFLAIAIMSKFGF